jgi:hypothetical protein
MSKIAILAWGSLFWDKRILAIQNEWNNDGPTLPIAFSRISQDGRLTLVIDPKYGDETQCFWALSEFSDLKNALNNLASREGTILRYIGYADVSSKSVESRYSNSIFDNLLVWGKNMNIDFIIWTDLPSNFSTKYGMPYSQNNAYNYLSTLQGNEKEKALEYIKRSPDCITSPLRKMTE